MELLAIKCALCKKKFFRSTGRVNEAKKFGWNPFCSVQCMAKSKQTGKELRCSNPECRKKFWRTPRDIKKVTRSFCSASCSAKTYNKIHLALLPIKLCAYQECEGSIPRNQKFCSQLHANRARKMPLDKQKKHAIERIKSFYKRHKRIPVKREMYGLYKETRRAFGSWNKAIEAAGYKSNPVLFARKYIANDGHKCDSFAEKIIDDWLKERDIIHKRSVPYPANKELTADFVVGNVWIEFFGLAGVLPKYDKLHRKKLRLATKHKIQLVEIFPKDLFPVNNLAKILSL